ncbi:heavy-metal-associated domain-containing protein [Galbibacter sp. BG1]|uniref:heavy-metal-associated domain-containing protein n=1 Tax=Galbibacter sp. BG1 TaxID=1170699 RepID=UPI0015BA2204|nr:heavy-metal-associated domain-containing protein [Galbibacter sp. BG1]QLE02506.1 heavy-metal-associated domain-containing protein [Galbibacter sp. BG1]
MKTNLILLLLLISISLTAQEKNKKETIVVSGNCAMCEARIEKAAVQTKGVKYASWDIPSHQLTLILDERKCSLEEVKKAIANAGHDTESFKAPDEVYNALPPCCLYRDPESIKMEHH